MRQWEVTIPLTVFAEDSEPVTEVAERAWAAILRAVEGKWHPILQVRDGVLMPHEVQVHIEPNGTFAATEVKP